MYIIDAGSLVSLIVAEVFLHVTTILSDHPHEVEPVKCLQVEYEASTTYFFAESSTLHPGPPSITFRFKQLVP